MDAVDVGEVLLQTFEETLEVGLFDWHDIPWDEIAFPTVTWALQHYFETRESRNFAPFANPDGETADLT